MLCFVVVTFFIHHTSRKNMLVQKNMVRGGSISRKKALSNTCNSILVWQLSEANKGTKVEMSASTEEEHNRRLPLSMAT